ncbi:MAG: hypothetical protein OEW62_03340 [Candidatus Bathyarchaeota archaeon]|nr:hypothetical protein [Candidatus Bathyarchaeota archaeon]MDH5746098.1 hypothetical protein [Candidatus Bathyarchaeota archaeon]
MPKKYYWNRAEEAKLIKLWKKGIANFEVLTKELDRTPGAVAEKVERLSLSPQRQTTTSVHLSEDLLTHEQALKILCSVLHTLGQSDLVKLELQRLRIVVDVIHSYDSVLEKCGVGIVVLDFYAWFRL